MATMKRFEVELLPAESDGAFISTKFEPFGGIEYPKREILASNLDVLITEISKFALEHGEGCAAWVKCLEKRKPAHFDKRTRRLYYNLA